MSFSDWLRCPAVPNVRGGEGAIGHAAVDRAHAEEESDAQMGLLAKHLSCLGTPSESAAGEPTEATSRDQVAAEGHPSQVSVG